jgi:phosphoglycolate phosphatase-like HAD superfamily hydrolase
VFDVDGVLADVRHRLHHLARRPKDWEGFFSAMSDDLLLPEGAALVEEQVRLGHQVVYLTGRNETYREDTEAWLDRHGLPSGRLFMRRPHDRRPARVFKPDTLRHVAESFEVIVVVDDDAAVVTSLRDAGWNVLHATWMDEEPDEQQALFDAQETQGRT